MYEDISFILSVPTSAFSILDDRINANNRAITPTAGTA
jgi:hypothetical protein